MFLSTALPFNLKSFRAIVVMASLVGGFVFGNDSQPLLAQVFDGSGTQKQNQETSEPIGEEREFRSESGDVVAQGTLVRVRGNQVVIRDPNGIELSVALARLSEADRQWVADEVELRRIHGIARKKLEKINEDYLQSVKQSKVIAGLERILRLGKEAPFAAPVAEEYLVDSNPVSVRAVAFATRTAVVPASELNLQQAFASMIDDQYGINAELIGQPENVIMAISTFGEMSLPYLKAVAFSGNVIPAGKAPVAPAEPAINLRKEQVVARIAAVKAIATLSSTMELARQEETLQTILQILSSVEQAGGTVDPKSTIRACISGFGTVGISNAEVLQKLNQFSSDPNYAKQVQRVRTRLERSPTQ